MPKLESNARRDRKNIYELETLGWRVLTIWECECKASTTDALKTRILRFLED
jgi:DNA mismatch endonuclease (patch repair protein)